MITGAVSNAAGDVAVLLRTVEIAGATNRRTVESRNYDPYWVVPYLIKTRNSRLFERKILRCEEEGFNPQVIKYWREQFNK